jgi:hypothetical protein
MTVRRPLRQKDLDEGRVPAETIALAAWPGEVHVGSGKGSRWYPIGGGGVFGIVLDNLRSADTPNMLGAGRVLSGDAAAAASVRVMGTAFATGHAAGIAAAHLAVNPTLDDATLTDGVRTSLIGQNALLELP